MLFLDFLESQDVKYKIGVNTSKISSLRVGGVASWMVYPTCEDELLKVVSFVKDKGYPFKIIGACTNTFFADCGYDGVIISTRLINGIKINNDNTVLTYAGDMLNSVLKYTADHSLAISPELYGIPGTIGGAVRNNAGAYGVNISDVFIRGDFLDTERMKVVEMSCTDLNFSYRYSLLSNGSFIFIRGIFKTSPIEKTQLYSDMNFHLKKRLTAQPSNPSVGSFFKRGKNYYASKLIDEVGLRGYSVNDAQISNKHAGFIINKGTATAKDVLTLADYAYTAVFKKFGIALEREAEYVM